MPKICKKTKRINANLGNDTRANLFEGNNKKYLLKIIIALIKSINWIYNNLPICDVYHVEKNLSRDLKKLKRIFNKMYLKSTFGM